MSINFPYPVYSQLAIHRTEQFMLALLVRNERDCLAFRVELPARPDVCALRVEMFQIILCRSITPAAEKVAQGQRQLQDIGHAVAREFNYTAPAAVFA